MEKKLRFNHVGPQFAVKDVQASIKFYRDVLGFNIDFERGSPAQYAVVNSDEVYIHLCLPETQTFKLGPGCCFISISNVEMLWNRVRSSQAQIILPMETNDYGDGVVFKGFTIADPDQNILRIGQPLNLV